MKLSFSDFKKGIVKLVIDNPDDFWYLHRIIEPDDIIKGRTLRKVSVGSDKSESERRPIFLELKVTKNEFPESGEGLRVTGTITSAPEDVPLGSHHTFNVKQGDSLKIIKRSWASYIRKILEDALRPTRDPVLIVAFERGSASFAILSGPKVDYLPDFIAETQGKQFSAGQKKEFFTELAKYIFEIDARQNFAKIVLSSPGFWKKELQKTLDDSIKDKSIFAICQGSGKAGINETLKRPELTTALAEERTASEQRIVETLLENISKVSKSCYGLDHVLLAAKSGAAEHILVSEELIHSLRKEKKFFELEQALIDAEKSGSSIHIISAEHDAGKKLMSLGGVGAILRYDMTF